MAKKEKNSRLSDPVKFFNNWMRNILRGSFFRWHERTAALQKARIERGLYLCAVCKKRFKVKEVRVDHIDPVVDPKTGFVDWDVYIGRLFCPAANLQILCKPCHHEKTQVEKEQRKLHGTGIFSAACRAKMSITKKGHHHNLGSHWTEESKIAVSKKRKGLLQTPKRSEQLKKTHEDNKRPIIAKHTDTAETREFASIDDAAKALNLVGGNISRACRGIEGRKQVGGWTFAYKDNEVTAEDLDEFAKRFPNQETQ